METDTVPFGFYRKEIFNKIGGFDVRLIRNQDIELNKRLIANGGKIYLVPDVFCIYYCRDTFTKIAKNNFGNGEWVILTAYLTKRFSSLSIRHFIPLLFAFYIYSIPFLVFISIWSLIPICFYLLINLFFSVNETIREKNIKMLPLFLYGFLLLHLSYGNGSLFGLWQLVKLRKNE